MEEFHKATGSETVSLGVLRNGMIVYVDMIESTHAVRRIVDATVIEPFYASALGRAIVANLPARRRNHLLNHTIFKPLTPQLGQAQAEVGCVAAPVFNGAGVMAAVSVTAPLTRLSENRCKQLIPVVRRAADKLSRIITQQSKELP